MSFRINSGYALYIIALFFTALNLFLQVLPMNTSEYFQEHLSLTANQVVSLTSIFFIFYSGMQIPAGLIFDKYGLKVILPLALFLTLVGSILYMLSANGIMLAFSRTLTGLGSSIAYIAGIYLAVKCFPGPKVSFFIALVEASATVGAILAAKTFHEIMTNYGWVSANMLIIIFTGILFVLSLIFLRGMQHERTVIRSIKQVLLQAVGLFRNKILILLFLYSFFTWAIIMSFAGYWLKNYMIFMHHYSEAASLSLVQIYWASFLVSGLIVGFYIKDIKQCKIGITLLSLLGFLTFVGMSVPILFNHIGLIAVSLLGGVSASGVILAFTLITKVVNPEVSGTAIAVNNTFIVLGGWVGQVLFGIVVSNTPKGFFSISNTIDPHYYYALLLYPLFTFIALATVLLALFFMRKIKI